MCRAAVEDTQETLRTYAEKNSVDIEVDPFSASLTAAPEAALVARGARAETNYQSSPGGQYRSVSSDLGGSDER